MDERGKVEDEGDASIGDHGEGSVFTQGKMAQEGEVTSKGGNPLEIEAGKGLQGRETISGDAEQRGTEGESVQRSHGVPQQEIS